jgi:membrane protease YdiL (CAAX protease family)
MATTLAAMQLAPTPPAPAERRTLAEEVLVVLALSLLASAAYAIVSLFQAPLRGEVVAAADQNPLFVNQFLGFVFGLAPVFLVVYLVRREGEGVGAIGLAGDRPGWDLAAGSLLFLVVAAGGIAIYLTAVQLGVNRFVIPAPPPDHWWTYPAVFKNAAGAALLEEVIVLAYLLTRLRQIGWSPVAAVLASAALRGGYHLYQGWGGFAGNFLMGLLFGVLFLRWRRTWPFVIAHFLLDAGAAVGFLLFRRHLPGFS